MSPAEPLSVLLSRALAAPAPFARAVATDADGTLWAADVGDALFLHVARRALFRGEGLRKLRAHARALVDETLGNASPTVIAETLFARYQQGAIDVRIMCDLEAETVGDRPAAELDALIAEVTEAHAGAVRPRVRALLHAARAAGIAIHVVSGSLDLVVRAMLERVDIPFDRVTGAALARIDGAVSATVARTSPLFEGKVAALRESGAWPAALGLGDGTWDHTFLREVHVPVLVHPQPGLREAMRDVPHAVEISG